MNKQVLLKMLAEGATTVKFTKKDGTIREMYCTRDPNLIPTEFHPKNKESETELESIENIRVFDIDKQAWRSFNFSSIM